MTKRFGPQVTFLIGQDDADEAGALASEFARDRSVVLRQAVAAGMPLIADYYRRIGGRSHDPDLELGDAALDALRQIAEQTISTPTA